MSTVIVNTGVPANPQGMVQFPQPGNEESTKYIFVEKKDSDFVEPETNVWKGLDRFYFTVETKFLNPLGYVPVVGMFVSATRAGLAAIQIKVGIVSAVAEGILSVATSGKSSTYHANNCSICATHIVHGFLNGFRAPFELVPFLPWFTLAFYDLGGTIFPYVTSIPKPYQA